MSLKSILKGQMHSPVGLPKEIEVIREIKTFLDKQKLREFVANGSALQGMLKEVF